jgi:small subunit ribosomal protein S14
MIKTKSVQQRRDVKRRELADAFRRQRAQRKAQSVNMKRSEKDRNKAKTLLEKMNRDTAEVRVVNRCVETGHARSVTRMFRRSRHVVRDLMMTGELPGFIKAS